jgi:putative membrane protein insertion efficiency factor
MRKLVFPGFFLMVIFPFFCLTCPGQSLIDGELNTLFQKEKTSHADYSEPLKNVRNEIDLSLATGFFIYKNFISSQDQPSCIFTPSCSEYAIESFRQKGLIAGWLSTFDRLSRCHGLVNPVHYPYNEKTNKFYDPVE